jgi:thiosulfate/3-mercaptopyruvate sulfurtransferase
MRDGGDHHVSVPDVSDPDVSVPDVSVRSVRPLISVTELADAVAAGPAPVLIDVRWRLGGPPGIDSYRSGHLPGAVYLDLDRQLAGEPGVSGRHPLPETADFESAMREAGVTGSSQVVVYDESDATIAARAWWMLRFCGHENVRVLDGGYRAWAAAGLRISTADPAPERGDFTARPGHLPVLDAAGAAALARSGILLDARAPARYRGETEPVDRVAGHIPGAISAPTAENVTSDGMFRPTAELRARFADLGIVPRQPDLDDRGHGGAEGVAIASPAVGAYCGSGVTAAHEVLALELAGIQAALYVGSWSGWVADLGRPVATGPQPG